MVVNVNELLEKYRALLAENLALKEENETLKARLGLAKTTLDPQQEPDSPSALSIEATGFPERETPSGSYSHWIQGEDRNRHRRLQGYHFR
ncbi:MAG: hypothetical protein FJ122_17015 [Deltaproteobacteria bacterium]|nr:hypothetical protein [Deltaproteobacteria bacterium]